MAISTTSYSPNGWVTIAGTEAMQSVGKKLYLRGKDNTTFCNVSNYSGVEWQLSAKAGCSGNIQALLDYENPPTSIPASNCYFAMFKNCTNLTSAPSLLATTLTSACYYHMFYGCTSLTSLPELPATTLSGACYFGMFGNCTGIKLSTTQTAEYKTSWRIPSSGTIPSEPSNWGHDMFNGTGGTFTGDPSINTTYYGAWGTSGGGGDTPTIDWNEVNGGTFYGGTYFLRLEPDMSLANDSTWDT